MKTAGYKVLLIEPSGNRKKLLLDILRNLDLVVVQVNSIETAIQKAISLSPDLIICQEEFGDYTGFQVYNMLENEILKNGIPFIIMLNDYNRNSIMMGEELGIDGYIIPPYEPEKISNILQTRIRKFRAQQSMSLKYFNRLCELIPMGIFIAENRRIKEANKYFYSLLDDSEQKQKKFRIDELFDFEADAATKTKLSRFLNGLKSCTCFSSIAMKTKPDEKYKLNLFYLETGLPGLKVVGLVVPHESDGNGQVSLIDEHEGNGKQDQQQKTDGRNNFFTKREQQILILSGQGRPIKLIADELGISERTVEKHRSNILHKTNTGNIIEALFFVKKNDIFELN